MKKLIVLLGLGIMGQGAMAVTPAPLALEKVKAYFDEEIKFFAIDEIPPHKSQSYLVEFESRYGRGKFSEDEFGFADFSGTTRMTFQWGSDTYHSVECRVSARVEVVGFAMQMVPILEEEVNEKQLVLKKHWIKCELAR